ncbi:MAG: ATP-binding cassette domain-containing protein [Acidimicrobiales bacterium]|nr:ATP-binding cassette domain-containing protein [Acidimicrobiales bacterium]
MTVLEAVGCRYRARWARGLETWDLVVGRGAAVHVVGANGTGKSTFLRAVVGLQPARWAHRSCEVPVRYLPTSGGLSMASRVGTCLEVLGRRFGVDASTLERELERWQLGAVVDRWVGSLSTGERRAVALAIALAPGSHACALVLDEPFSALDEGRRMVLSSVLEEVVDRGDAVVLTGHDVPAALRSFAGVVEPG